MKRCACSIAGTLAATTLAVASDSITRIDPLDDAVARPTDVSAPFDETALPDLLELTISGWSAIDPVNDPYTGTPATGETADLFRIDIVFNGLINPPGPLGLTLAPWAPFQFGPRPVYGFIEINMDRNRETGGELGSTAENRYLANVGRFGRRTDDSIADRMAVTGDQIDGNFYTPPFIERSGAEFDFGFCGCFDTQLVSEIGNGDGIMDEDETFFVRGRFFRRVASFFDLSGMEGGSFGGLYDPIVDVRFEHDSFTDRTTVSFVGALTMAGASQLTGQPEQFADFLVDNHWSVYEALFDIIDGAQGLNGPGSPESNLLISDWASELPDDHLDPTRWRVLALIGTTYTSPQSELFVWTDSGFDETHGDFNGDTLADAADQSAVMAHIASRDGTAQDADGQADGHYTISNPGPNFSSFDLTGDGIVNQQDVDFFNTGIPADLNTDGTVNAADLALLLSQWNAPGSADLNGSGTVDAADLALLIAAWGP